MPRANKKTIGGGSERLGRADAIARRKFGRRLPIFHRLRSKDHDPFSTLCSRLPEMNRSVWGELHRATWQDGLRLRGTT
jgi:hypothetical protein